MNKREALRKRLIEKSKKKVSEAYTGRDYHIVKAVNLLEDLDSVFNLLSENARDWYSAHFPELNVVVQDNESYLKLMELGGRKNFKEKNILKVFNKKEKAKEIEIKAANSMGSEIGKEDLSQIQVLAENALSIKKEREELAKYIEKLMKSLLPNFTEIAQPLIGAKLLSKAGSVKRLALMPSSTVQILGAEKALFRHLKKKAKPPKYGVIFAHPLLREVGKEKRGKIARSLAGKLSIAVKEDYFGKKNIAKELKKKLDKRVKEVKGKQ